jgi:23S rRNA (pseudouridine1915-N3)-methyltransferase
MHQIRLLYIGKTKFRWVQAGVQHYQKEIKPFAKFELHEVKAVAGRYPEAELMRREAMRFKGNIDRSETVVCLDRGGQRFTSEAFARWLSSQAERGSSLAFVIGGSYGLDPEFKRKAQATMSLSAMTFPHDLVRLVFTEQLFRALAILHGHPYHKKTPTSSKR